MSRWKKEVKSKDFLILQTSVHVKLLEDCKSFYHELVETLDTHLVQYIKKNILVLEYPYLLGKGGVCHSPNVNNWLNIWTK